MTLTEAQYQEILDIGIALSTERNYTKLLELILNTTMAVTHCDGGTLYIYEKGYLHFNIMRTVSLDIYRGGSGEAITLPPVALKEENVCAYAAIHNEVVNIEDVHHSPRFDFSGPKKYDSLIHYHTKSMLVVPMRNHEQELIGVLQLLNALDQNGNIIPFQESLEKVIAALVSQAAIAVSNMRYFNEIKVLLNSFVDAMGAAVDLRSPYNGNHTRKVIRYTEEFCKYLHELYLEGTYEEAFEENRIEQMTMAAALHDVGKLTIELDVMNKGSRLEGELEKIEYRFLLIKSRLEIDLLNNLIDQNTFEQECRYLNDSLALIKEVNCMDRLPDEYELGFSELASKSYTKPNGLSIPYLTEYEQECLSIKTGTLTEEERRIMQSHVTMTSQILNNIRFNKYYCNVAHFASCHHEFLDGSGYPARLTAEDLCTDIRILTIVDIYDALTSRDRPYKVPLPKEKAVAILHLMAEEGKLDHKLVRLFEQFLAQSADSVI